MHYSCGMWAIIPENENKTTIRVHNLLIIYNSCLPCSQGATTQPGKQDRGLSHIWIWLTHLLNLKTGIVLHYKSH